jgi:hypothetical protein
MIRGEKFKGAMYCINTGQNGIRHVFLAISRLLEFIVDGGQLVVVP